jgi:hypothetical protein
MASGDGSECMRRTTLNSERVSSERAGEGPSGGGWWWGGGLETGRDARETGGRGLWAGAGAKAGADRWVMGMPAAMGPARAEEMPGMTAGSIPNRRNSSTCTPAPPPPPPPPPVLSPG